jgi:hypothetical protein
VADSPTSSPLRDASAILWTEAQRQITRQEADLTALRNRAIAMLSVSSLVAALFGSHIATVHLSTRATAATIVALVAFGLGTLISLDIVTPRRAWVFTDDPQQYFDLLSAGTLNPVTVTSNLAEHFEEYRAQNQQKINQLYNYLIVVCVLIAIQVIAWGVAAL